MTDTIRAIATVAAVGLMAVCLGSVVLAVLIAAVRSKWK